MAGVSETKHSNPVRQEGLLMVGPMSSWRVAAEWMRSTRPSSAVARWR